MQKDRNIIDPRSAGNDGLRLLYYYYLINTASVKYEAKTGLEK
jgi:hypothetical protein